MPPRATRPVLASLSCVLLVLGGCLGTSHPVLPVAHPDGRVRSGCHGRASADHRGGSRDPAALSGPAADCHKASQAQLHVAEFDQWAASLQDTVARVLAENLSLLLPTAGGAPSLAADHGD